MINTDDNGFHYYNSLKEAKEDGYAVIKVWNPLQFYYLPRNRSVLSVNNILPIPDLRYTVATKVEDRFYVREFRDIPAQELRFYYSNRLSPVDEGIEALRTYIYDDRVSLILTAEQVEDIKAMLSKVYKSKLTGEGTFDYKAFIALLEETLALEDYKSYAQNLVGFMTVCKQYNDRIAEILKSEYERNNKKDS